MAMTLKPVLDFFSYYLIKKAPGIPKSYARFLVKIIPWLSLLAAFILLPFFFTVVSALPFSLFSSLRLGLVYGLSVLFLVVSIVLEFSAVPGLFKKTRTSWRFLFYSTLSYSLYLLINFKFFSLVLAIPFCLYLLFQIKSHYR